MNDYLNTLFDLQGKVAVVIGGTGELCGAMAEGLANAGVSVVLAGRSAEKAAVRLERIDAAGGKAAFCPVAVDSKTSLRELLDFAVETFGAVDIVINGAGINAATPFLDISEEEFGRIIDTNLKAIFLSCQVFGKYFLERGAGGSIINVGSITGTTPLSRVFTYSTSKAGVHNISKNLAREWATKGIRVNVIIPGFFPAEQNRKVLDASRIAAIMSQTPIDRFGESHELIGATLLLASAKAGSFITGAEFVVDGGFAATRI